MLRQTQQYCLHCCRFLTLHYILHFVKMCKAMQNFNVKNGVKAQPTESTGVLKLLLIAACAGLNCDASVFVVRFDLG